MKNERQAQILDLIAQKDIETQNQMMEALAERGVRSTQATISRDIKELRLVKEATPNGGYRYAAPLRENSQAHLSRLHKIFRESVVSYDTAQNLVVIRTLPGLASAVASAMDSTDIPNLVGTLAGDDTVFIAMRTQEDAAEFCREIGEMV